MRLLDKQYTDTPYYGSRKMTAWLNRQGYQVNRKRVRRLMQTMGLETIYQKPDTSRANPENKVYPYLLRDLEITHCNRVMLTSVLRRLANYCSSNAVAFSTPTRAHSLLPHVFTQPLLDKGIKVSMDGRGRALDNIFVERLWRSVKYEYVYLQELDSVAEARQGLQNYSEFYNQQRLHQSPGYQAPAQVYFSTTSEHNSHQPNSLLTL